MGQEQAEKITYDDHAKPILLQRCGSCHNGQRREGDLDVTNYINLMQGGGSGAVIEPTDSAGSYLYSLITHEDSPEMPPSGTKIPDPEIALLGKWIDMGALENMGSKAAKPKPKLNMTLAADPNARPEKTPLPLTMPLEPVIDPDRPSVLTMATSPWAPVAAISTPRQILLYNTSTMQLAGVLPLEEGVAHSLKFTRSGQYLIAGGGKDGASGKAFLFNALTGERVLTVGDELEAVLAADISSNQQYVAYGGPNKLVKLCYVDGTVITEIKKHTDWVTALEFSPDGKYFASGDRNGGLHVWDAESGSPMFSLGGHSGQISAISWRADSQLVASASEDNTVRIWELKEGKQVKSWTAHGGGVTAMEFRRDGNLVTGGRDKLVKLWDGNGKMLRQFGGLTDVVVAATHCDETDRVLAADWTGQILVWNAADGGSLGNLAANPPRLEERIATSQAALEAATAKYQPLATQVTQTKQNMDSMTQTLGQTKQTVTELQTKLAQEQQQLAAATEQFQVATQQHQQYKTEHDTKAAAKPLLAATLQKAQEAVKVLPADEELKQTVATLDGKLKQVAASITELAGQVQSTAEAMATHKSTMNKLTQAVATSKQQMETKSVEVTQLEAQLTKLKEAFAAQQSAATAAQQKVQTVSAELNRWKENQQFIAQMETLQQQLTSASQVVTDKQAAVDAAHQELVAAQQKVDAAKQQQAQAEQQTVEIRNQIEALRGQ